MADYVDVTADVTSVTETAAAFNKRAENLQGLIDQKRDALTQARQRDIDNAGVIESGPDGQRVVDKDLRRQELGRIDRVIRQEVNEFRSTLMESSAKERTAMLNALLAKGERLDALQATFPNATAWLTRAGLGSTERANLQVSLAGADKAELASLGQQAMLSGNRILAAAVITVNERLSQRDRFEPSIEYATRFVGDEHKAWLKSIADARDKIKASIELDNLLVTGSESPRTRIERGLRQRGLAA